MRRCALLLLLTLAFGARAEAPLQVAVAANFRQVLEALNPRFEQQAGVAVSLSSASTGVLHSQVLHGAPFDVLLAADADSPARLAAAGLASEPACYALGRLVLVGAGDFAALAEPGRSLAIANPATAPYGRAAKQVLARAAFAAGAPRKQVLGNNAVQAYQFWHSGAVDLALVPRALAPGLAVPATWHAPIAQHAALLKRGADNPAARAYLDWLRSPEIQAAILGKGYDSCP